MRGPLLTIRLPVLASMAGNEGDARHETHHGADRFPVRDRAQAGVAGVLAHLREPYDMRWRG